MNRTRVTGTYCPGVNFFGFEGAFFVAVLRDPFAGAESWVELDVDAIFSAAGGGPEVGWLVEDSSSSAAAGSTVEIVEVEAEVEAAETKEATGGTEALEDEPETEGMVAGF